MVTVFSDCEQVRLIQNRKVVVMQRPDADYHLAHPPFIFWLERFTALHSMLFATGVAKPGTEIGVVRAEGLIAGAIAATHELRSPGVPTQLKFVADSCGRGMMTDGADWIRVYAYICDARGATYAYGEDEIISCERGRQHHRRCRYPGQSNASASEHCHWSGAGYHPPRYDLDWSASLWIEERNASVNLAATQQLMLQNQFGSHERKP